MVWTGSGARLADETVQVAVGGAGNVQILLANVVDGLRTNKSTLFRNIHGNSEDPHLRIPRRGFIQDSRISILGFGESLLRSIIFQHLC